MLIIELAFRIRRGEANHRGRGPIALHSGWDNLFLLCAVHD
jgi:hypothetical protein